MIVRTRKPAPALQDFVQCYVHFEGRLQSAIVQPVPARTAPAIEFTFGNPYEIEFHGTPHRQRAHSIAVIGPQTFRRVDLVLRGHVETFVILFQPGGFRRLFSTPGDELVNSHFEGVGVLGRAICGLGDRLGHHRSFEQRSHEADGHLLDHSVGKSSSSAVNAAAAEALRRNGCVRISALAERTGLSLRQFERNFTSEIGLGPKVFARIARFEAALWCRARSPNMQWADVAHELGYHDQMHMLRDFRMFAGSPPSAISPQLALFATNEIDARAVD